MGLLDRTSNLARRRVDRLLDDLEDSGESLEYTSERLKEELRRVDDAVVDLVTERKRLEQRRAALEEGIDEYNERAREAVRAGRDDLAREVLERKQADVSRLNDVDDRIAQLREDEADLRERRDDLKARVDQFRAERARQNARRTAARAEANVSEATGGSGDDPGESVGGATDRIDEAEARAAALEELREEGFFDDRRLDEELERLRTDAEVDAELDTLRDEVRGDRGDEDGAGDGG